MENMARVVNSTPNSSVKVPCTKHSIKKFMQPDLRTEIYIQCPNCLSYVQSFESETECDTCGIKIKTSMSDYFVHIPIRQQLMLSLDRNFDEIISYASSVVQNKKITDLHNAQIFKSAQKNHPKSILLPLVVNTDGVKVFKSAQKSLWLIQASQAFLPPSIRYWPKNALVIAAHFGQKKPKMKDFFYPLLRDLKKINEEGGIKIIRNGQMYDFMPLILCCCCDLPAKADLQGTIGHSGRFGCSYCLHPGISVKSDNDKKAVIRYVKGKNNYEIRTHQSFIEIYNELHRTPICGVKTMSCMVAAHEFDLVHGFAIDTMHCVHLGVVKKMLSLWLDSCYKLKPYFIKKKDQVTLSSRLVNIKPVSDIIRKPKSIFSKGEFKANEFRCLLYYYLPFALSGLLPMKYLSHFRLLSFAIYTLSKNKISFEDIEMARIQLNQFVDTFEDLYTKSNVTMNLHLLKHLPMSVEKLGPLWATSAYVYEANNGVITKANTSPKDIAHQLAFKYVMKQTIIPEQEQTVNLKLNGKGMIKISSTEKEIFVQKGLEMQNIDFVEIYKSVTIHGIKFTSEKSKDVATIDFFVRLKDDSIGAINFYLLINFDLHALITLYEIIETTAQFSKIKRSQTQKAIKMNEISEKMLYLRIGINEFVTVFPNKFEKT